MSRLLLLALVIIAVYLLIRAFRKQQAGQHASKPEAQDMVSCKHCGVHLPKQEAIQAGGNYYCSEAHRLAHASKSDKS